MFETDLSSVNHTVVSNNTEYMIINFETNFNNAVKWRSLHLPKCKIIPNCCYIMHNFLEGELEPSAGEIFHVYGKIGALMYHYIIDVIQADGFWFNGDAKWQRAWSYMAQEACAKSGWKFVTNDVRITQNVEEGNMTWLVGNSNIIP